MRNKTTITNSQLELETKSLNLTQARQKREKLSAIGINFVSNSEKRRHKFLIQSNDAVKQS